MSGRNFDWLRAECSNQIRTLLSDLLPGGRVIADEYCCSDLTGGSGKSLKYNLSTHLWCDFETGQKGHHVVDLVQQQTGLTAAEVYDELANRLGLVPYAGTPIRRKPHGPAGNGSDRLLSEGPAVPAPLEIPPDSVEPPTCEHVRYGLPHFIWAYRTADGDANLWIARYDTPEGKQIVPWIWTADGYVARGAPAPRPLYNLHLLTAYPGRHVCIVEGEKSAEAAQVILGKVYVITTWPGGAQAYRKVDWSPLAGRKVLIWPDADEPGVNAAEGIVDLLAPVVDELKVIDPCSGADHAPDGWDAADALAAGWDFKQWRAWVLSRLETIELPTKVVASPAPVKTNGEHSPTPMPIQTVSIESGAGLPTPEVAAEFFAREMGLQVNGKGKPYYNLANVLRVLRLFPGIRERVWYDTFKQEVVTDLFAREVESYADHRLGQTKTWLQEQCGLPEIRDHDVRQGIMLFARERERSCIREWAKVHKWDGKLRIDTFFIRCYGVADSVYSRAVSKNFWLSLAARVLIPGCKQDHMVILEGIQGSRKSSSLSVIAGDYFATCAQEIRSKDFYQAIQGKVLIEFGDLDKFSNSDINEVKNMLSTTVDRFRPPYGREALDFPRQCIFIGTTNNAQYLRDPTGNRRFWPLKTTTLNFEAIQEERDQCWAEAVARIGADEHWWEMPEEETKAEQEARRQTDLWHDKIAYYLLGMQDVTSAEVAEKAVEMPTEKMNHGVFYRIAAIMKELGWEAARISRNGRQCRGWVKSVSSVKVCPDQKLQ